MYFIIGLCIGFIVGNIVGVVLMSIMASASRDSREREEMEFENCFEILDYYERKNRDDL